MSPEPGPVPTADAWNTLNRRLAHLLCNRDPSRAGRALEFIDAEIGALKAALPSLRAVESLAIALADEADDLEEQGEDGRVGELRDLLLPLMPLVPRLRERLGFRPS